MKPSECEIRLHLTRLGKALDALEEIAAAASLTRKELNILQALRDERNYWSLQ